MAGTGQEEPGPTLGHREASPRDHPCRCTPLNLINVGAAGDPLNSPGMGLCWSMVTEEESPGTEISTNVTTVFSVLKRDHLPSKSVDIPEEDVVIGAVPHSNPLARARERKKNKASAGGQY